MNIKIINTSKKQCPIPLIMLKKGLMEHKNGFILIIDNKIAKENAIRFLSENQIEFACTEVNETYRFKIKNIKNSDIEKIGTKIQQNHTRPTIGKHAICIKSNKMGNGPDELGLILLNAFINNLKEVSPLPSAIIFYNSGIMLTLNDSPVIDTLKKLETSSVKILVCGACVDYYKLENKIGAGIISNMYEISERLTKASHIIYP